MTFKILFLFLVVTLYSCSPKEPLIADFNCKPSSALSNLKQTTDFKKNFSIEYPNTWKTKLYYDSFQSEIMIADTLKSLTKTFIYDASWNSGEIEINDTFATTMNAKVLAENQLKTIQSGFSKLHKKPFYWHLSEGKKNNREYQLLKTYVKTGVDTYLMVAVDFYGKNLVNERICQAIEIFETTQFLKQ